MSEPELCGFLMRREVSGVCWDPCYDAQRMLEAEPELASFARDQEELQATLLAEHPDLEPDLGRVTLTYGGVELHDQPCYRGKVTDGARLAELARKHGPVRCTNYRADPSQLLEHGCVLANGEARYDPKLIAKRQREQQKRDNAKLVGIHDVRALYCGLRDALPSLRDKDDVPRQDVPPQELPLACARALLAGSSKVSLVEELRDLLGLVTIVTALLGQARVRKLPCVRSFLQDWARNRAKNEAKFVAVCYGPELVALLPRLGLRSEPVGSGR